MRKQGSKQASIEIEVIQQELLTIILLQILPLSSLSLLSIITMSSVSSSHTSSLEEEKLLSRFHPHHINQHCHKYALITQAFTAVLAAPTAFAIHAYGIKNCNTIKPTIVDWDLKDME